MRTPDLPIAPETENLLEQHGGPLEVPGQKGRYVLMRADVYEAMLGLDADDDAETIASVRRGLADVDAGRMRDLDDVFDDLDLEQ